MFRVRGRAQWPQPLRHRAPSLSCAPAGLRYAAKPVGRCQHCVGVLAAPAAATGGAAGHLMSRSCVAAAVASWRRRAQVSLTSEQHATRPPAHFAGSPRQLNGSESAPSCTCKPHLQIPHSVPKPPRTMQCSSFRRTFFAGSECVQLYATCKRAFLCEQVRQSSHYTSACHLTRPTPAHGPVTSFHARLCRNQPPSRFMNAPLAPALEQGWWFDHRP